MKLKSILLFSFIYISFQLSAQIVAISEGTSSNFKTLLELPDGSVLAGIDANFYGESYSNFTLLKFDNKGQLDERFGNQGKYRYKAPRRTEEEKQIMHIEDMLLLSDGKILIAGWKEYSSDNIFLLRLLPGGNPDSTFGSNGYTNLIQTYLTKPIIRLMAIDNHNFYACYINESGRIGSFKINEKGDPDNNYGNDKGQFSFSNDQQKAYYANYGNIEKDTKNRLYFTTFCQSNEDGHIMQIYRVTPDGKLDQDFAENGVRKLLTDKEYKKYFKAGNTTFLPDHKILVSTKYVVTKDNKATGYHIIFKLNEDGSPDLTFAEKGMATITITPGDDPMSRIATLPDGKIMTWDIADLIASGNNLKTKVLVGRRLSKNGQVDKTFGKNGVGLNTLLQLSGVIDFKGMNNTEKYYYVFGLSYLKVDGPWLSTVIKLKMLPNNKLEDIIKNDIAFNELNEPGVIGLSITSINTGEINTNSVAITKGDQGGKQPTQEEKNLMTMIKTLVNEAEKVRTVFTTFDKKQMSGGVVSLDFVSNSALLEKAIKNYISVSNSFANGKYGIRTNGWKNYVPLSLFLKRENELTDEMKNLIDHIDKCLEYIDKFTRDNKRMPAGVGNYMEMADYKFSKRIDEFIKTYKSIILE